MYDRRLKERERDALREGAKLEMLLEMSSLAKKQVAAEAGIAESSLSRMVNGHVPIDIPSVLLGCAIERLRMRRKPGKVA